MNAAAPSLLLAAAAPLAGPGRLLFAVVLAVAIIVGLISWLKLHPFLALTLGSAALALVAGAPVDQALTSFGKGFGGTTADVGILIALGAMIGKLLAVSGGAAQIVDTLLAGAGPRRLPWVMALIAFLIGIPMFFEVGLVLLMPVVLGVARRGHPLIRVGIPALAGLSVLHGFVPPHPGPLIAISALHANLGLTLALGITLAVPTVALAGPLLAVFLSRRVEARPPQALVEAQAEAGAAPARRPSFGVTLGTILLPVVLMVGRTVAQAGLDPGPLRDGLTALGSPLVALLLGTLVAMVTLGRAVGLDRAGLSAAVGGALPAIAGILLIVGAGGGFKQTIVDTGVAAEIAAVAGRLPVSPLLVGWVLAVLIRLATGSATVATTTAAGILSPLAAGLSAPHLALLVLAVGAGSLFLSHVNDAGFWLVKEYFGMSVGETLQTWSVMETVISVTGLVLVLLAGLVV